MIEAIDNLIIAISEKLSERVSKDEINPKVVSALAELVSARSEVSEAVIRDI